MIVHICPTTFSYTNFLLCIGRLYWLHLFRFFPMSRSETELKVEREVLFINLSSNLFLSASESITESYLTKGNLFSRTRSDSIRRRQAVGRSGCSMSVQGVLLTAHVLLSRHGFTANLLLTLLDSPGALYSNISPLKMVLLRIMYPIVLSIFSIWINFNLKYDIPIFKDILL